VAVGNQFGLTSGNRSDTLMKYTVTTLDEVFVFMLYGGDKSSQVADIAIAKQLARNLKESLQ
jgi:putative component of toxin-antitoxin plasmid stabilization module